MPLSVQGVGLGVRGVRLSVPGARPIPPQPLDATVAERNGPFGPRNICALAHGSRARDRHHWP